MIITCINRALSLSPSLVFSGTLFVILFPTTVETVNVDAATPILMFLSFWWSYPKGVAVNFKQNVLFFYKCSLELSG